MNRWSNLRTGMLPQECRVQPEAVLDRPLNTEQTGYTRGRGIPAPTPCAGEWRGFNLGLLPEIVCGRAELYGGCPFARKPANALKNGCLR
jgi:hypothetical protein